MRLIALEGCASIVALLFFASLTAIAAHRAKRNPKHAFQAASVPEYMWAVIPWAMVIACAFPAVWPLVAAQ